MYVEVVSLYSVLAECYSSGYHSLPLSFPQPLNPQVVPATTHELLNRITGQGLQVHYTFTRKSHLSSSKMLAIKLSFQNTLETPLSGISIGDTRLEVRVTASFSYAQ